MKKVIIFASGTSGVGVSGFVKLCQAVKCGELQAQIVAVVSNYEDGDVRRFAAAFDIPFVYFPSSFTAEEYRHIVAANEAEWTVLCDWSKPVKGLDPTRTINIHSGPLPHKAIIAEYNRNKITHIGVTMHFVTDNYDQWPTLLEASLEIHFDDTPETLVQRVHAFENKWQAIVTDMVLREKISWDGKNPVRGAILCQAA